MFYDIKMRMFSYFKWSYNVLAQTPLRKIPGMLSVSNVFFRLFWPLENIIEVQGNKMFIDINDPNPALRKTFQAYGMNLVHEEATTKLFRKVVKPGHIVLDLGANIGYFTILAARLVGPTGKVFSFEPEPTNFKYLSKNIALNKFHNVQAFQKAVSDKNGQAELFICLYDSGHHTINQYGGIEAYSHGRKTGKHPIPISIVALDDFLKDKTDHVDIIKMDVEGAEALTLAGMENILRQNANVKVFLEFFPLLMEKMGSDPDLCAKRLLEDFGFTVFAIGHDYDLHNSKEDLVKIGDVKSLFRLLKNEADHVNLYLTRDI